MKQSLIFGNATFVKRALAWWRLPVRQSEDGNWHYLYSLMAEGGSPEAYLAEVSRYQRTVLAMLAAIEAEGSLAEVAAKRIAWSRADSLPQTFRHQGTNLLFSDLALALARLRARLPVDMPPRAAEVELRAAIARFTCASAQSDQAKLVFQKPLLKLGPNCGKSP